MVVKKSFNKLGIEGNILKLVLKSYFLKNLQQIYLVAKSQMHFLKNFE